MRQSISAMMFCGLLACLGCQGSAKFKEHTANGGLIELDVKGDVADVQKLAVKELGKDAQIVEVTDKMQTPGKPNDGKRYYAVQKPNATPAGLPPAPGGQIQQTGASTGRLPQPQLPGMIGSGYPSAGVGQPGYGQPQQQQPGYGQPGMPSGRGSFAGDR